MLNDSSSTAEQPQKNPAHLRKPWGIIIGVIVPVLAIFAPFYILGPFFSAFVASLPLNINLKLSIAEAAIAGVAVVIVVGALALYGKTLRDLGLRRPQWQYLAKAVLGFLIYFAATFAIAVVYGLLHLPDQAQDIGYTKNLDGLDFALAGVNLILVVPFKEEIIFRGFMFKGFRNRLPFWVAAIGVSALFGLVHGQWNVGLDVFAMSMVSCYLVEKTNSLWPSIFLHMIKNGVAFSLLYLYNGH